MAEYLVAMIIGISIATPLTVFIPRGKGQPDTAPINLISWALILTSAIWAVYFISTPTPGDTGFFAMAIAIPPTITAAKRHIERRREASRDLAVYYKTMGDPARR